eukprot:1137280-Pelagomonas_calceolata.AAC.4
MKARSSAILSANPKPELHACVVTYSTRARTINHVASLRHTTAAVLRARIPNSSDAKLAGGGQILLYKPSALPLLERARSAVGRRRSTKPLCPLPGCHQLDSALHMLSGCQNHIICSMKTEQHNVAGRMIIKALSKSPWGA